MIEAYGKTIAVSKCKAGGEVDLSNKMLRAVHMDALGGALATFSVVSLNLEKNQLGPPGGATLAGALKGNTTLKSLKCAAAIALWRMCSLLCQHPLQQSEHFLCPQSPEQSAQS